MSRISKIVAAGILGAAAFSIHANAQQPPLPGLGALRSPTGVYESLPKFIKKPPGTVVPAASLIPNVPRAGNQGATGTCVGWSLSYIKTILDNRAKAADPNAANVQMSPMFVYMSATEDPQCQRGIYVNAAMGKLQEKGAATMAEMPFADANGLPWCRPASAAVVAAAAQRKTENFGTISEFGAGITPKDLDDLKYAVSVGYPVLVVVRVTSTLYRNWLYKTGNDVLSDVGQNELAPGGVLQYHAMTAVGYDDKKGKNGALRIINSWGEQFGDGGLFWLDYRAAGDIVVEAYTIYEK